MLSLKASIPLIHISFINFFITPLIHIFFIYTSSKLTSQSSLSDGNMHLNGRNDWENWQVQFEALARSENVWNIVTSPAKAKPMPKEPTPPEINTSLATTYGMATRSQTVSKTSEQEHTGPITQSPTYVYQIYQTHLKLYLEESKSICNVK